MTEAQPDQAWYRRLMPVPAPPRVVARTPSDRAAALSRFEELTAVDGEIPEPTRARMFEPDSPAAATIVIWHGFTNAPSQFVAVAEQLRDRGYRVLLPRMPYHGEADVLNRDLVQLTDAQLVEHVGAWIDLAAGFGDPVWVFGLSAGATLAGWAAACRLEVSRLVLGAPLVAPKGAPMPLVRALVRFRRIVPRFYYWWDPRVKENLGHSPYAYPGFPVPGLMPFLHLSESLFDRSVEAGHQLERVVLVSNPGDFAIRRDAARSFASGVFGARTDYLGEAGIDGELKWMHDFVDPWSPGSGTTEQVVAILLAGFGVGEPTAGGVLVPPLVEPQPPAAP
nr:alpha/beta fold hydrolase [Propionicimonas sp.]